ncbi:Uma2 family endonuclease [Saccharothrix coeruleofusca]|uniref:Putative restriction endonuclease domain-containing protein n=1 Tax=Saccharothrix coeruleofusca TaxID=33919 RepID=A0A918AKM1_9PSEU|nr:Uma2 family endonuclease [Saccharothrix coeruleofusca]GGP49359.1 hypothetical protein GCM10010185_21920 [Saccharothrix coeruleofusca]
MNQLVHDIMTRYRSQRVECVDGTLVVRALGTTGHQRLLLRCAAALRAACPPGWEALVAVGVHLAPGRLVIPDFTVNRLAGDGTALAAEDVVLAGEVLSPDTQVVDRTLKHPLYAAAGVPYHLVVDPSEAEVAAALFELEAAEYVEIARGEGGVIELPRPFPVTIELSP